MNGMILLKTENKIFFQHLSLLITHLVLKKNFYKKNEEIVDFSYKF